MPSPFPGMDPYIEDPKVWSDFHNDLAGEIRARLNQSIQPRYIARLTPYVTYEMIEIGEKRGVYPDVAIWQPQPPAEPFAAPVAVIAPAPVESVITLEFPLRLLSVEIRQVDTMELVTAIEILSPVNKKPGHDAYHDYRRKRRELLRSEANLIEIDFLRGGERMPLDRPVPRAPYYVLLSRVERRPRVAVWPLHFQDALPTIPVPLREPDPDVPLALGAVVASVYERGGYATLIDYKQNPPMPTLTDSETTWLDAHLRKHGLR